MSIDSELRHYAYKTVVERAPSDGLCTERYVHTEKRVLTPHWIYRPESRAPRPSSHLEFSTLRLEELPGGQLRVHYRGHGHGAKHRDIPARVGSRHVESAVAIYNTRAQKWTGNKLVVRCECGADPVRVELSNWARGITGCNKCVNLQSRFSAAHIDAAYRRRQEEIDAAG